MRTVRVFYPKVLENKEPEKKRLLWYDTDKNEMLHFEGSHLSFRYEYDEDLKKYRNVPYAEEGIVTKEEVLNTSAISIWFKRYQNYNDSNASQSSTDAISVLFNVPTNEIDDFIYDLERNNIRFSVT